MNEAKKLSELFKRVKNRAEFARTWKVPGGASMIYQHLNGIKPVSLEAALIYSQAFNVPLEEISPRIAQTYQKIVSSKEIDETKVAKSNSPSEVNEEQKFYSLSITKKNSNWLDQLVKDVESLPEKNQITIRETMTALIKSIQKQTS